MQNIKNIFVGFLVSFVGSIPLGYLNLIGFEIYSKKGFSNTIEYLLGVVFVEGIVIFLTLEFANFLTNQKKWMKRIDIFTIVFLLVLSSSFFLKSDASKTSSIYIAYPSFVTGLILSSLNFIQIPFWTGWNLYLINNSYLVIGKISKFFYLTGTLLGTFFGMLFLILGLNYFSKNNSFINQTLISKGIPVVFFALAIFQIIQFYRKYYRRTN